MTHFVKCRENEDDDLLFCIALRLWSSWLARTAPFSQAADLAIFYTSVNLGGGRAQTHLGGTGPPGPSPYIAATAWLYEQVQLSVLILVCIHKSYIVYLENYAVPIRH